MGKMKFGEKAKNPKGTFIRLMKDVFPGKFILILPVVIGIILSAVATPYSASFIGDFIDGIVIPLKGVENPDFAPAVRALVKFGAVVLVSIFSSYLVSRMMVMISQRSIYEMRMRMFRKLESLPLSYFDRNPRGTVMSRFSNDTDSLEQLLSSGFVSMLTSAATLIMVFVAMVRNNVLLLAVIIVFIFLTLFVTGNVGKRSGKYYKAQQKALSEVNGFIEEMIGGERVVKVFNHEDRNRADFEVLNRTLQTSMTEANSWAGSMGPLNNNLGHLEYVVLVLCGALIIILRPHWYTIGALATFLHLSRSFTNNVSQLSQQANNILLALAGAERIYAILDEKSESDEGDTVIVRVRKNDDGTLTEVPERTGCWAWKVPEGDGFHLVEEKGSVVVDHVDFGYTEDRTVLHDITLYAKPGQKIAFVGSTGAGKTTITNLLNRFYNISKGSITIDGIDISRIKLSALRRSMGMVLQDTNLFTGTIRENIRYGRLDATDEEVVEAAKLANAHDFILMMKDGYDTEITNNGENLSQGQRQLLSIARAAIANPPIMILDEATSSIDTHTESLVQSGMDKLMEGRTVFVIAHRLSTVRNSDAIMVLENGRIIERGDHDDLLEQKGTYWNLYTGMSELS